MSAHVAEQLTAATQEADEERARNKVALLAVPEQVLNIHLSHITGPDSQGEEWVGLQGKGGKNGGYSCVSHMQAM